MKISFFIRKKIEDFLKKKITTELILVKVFFAVISIILFWNFFKNLDLS